MIKIFHNLEVYQRSKLLYPQIIKATSRFSPQGFHLRDQLCRSANGIQANIAEGFGRSVSEFKMYLTRALGSCNETISHLEDAKNAELIQEKLTINLINEFTIVGKQLYRLRENWK